MKKLIYSLLFILFLLPVTALAETKVEVKSISFIEKSENTVINNEATTDGEKINLDLTFYDKNDYATYKVVVKNSNSVGLYINDSIFDSSDEHISYKFSYEDNSNFIKPDEEKTVTIKVMYSKEVPKELFRSTKYDASNNTPLVLSDKLIQIPNTLKNLGILGVLITGFSVLCIFTALAVIYKNKKVSSLNILVILLMILLVPKYADALLRVDIPIDSKIDVRLVKPRNCTFEGNLVQGARFISGQYTYMYKLKNNGTGWNAVNNDDGWGVTLTDKDSTDPVTSPICSTINDIPVKFFDYLYYKSKAPSVDLSTIDTSYAPSLNFLFGESSFTELDLSYINPSSAIQMLQTFEGMKNIDTIDISMWDTSHTTYFSRLFSDTNLKYINIDNVDFSNHDFYALYNLAPGSNLVKKISARNTKWPKEADNAFYIHTGWVDSALEEIDLTNADFSKTISMTSMFSYNPNLKEIKGLDTIKGGKPKNINYAFQHTEALEKIDLSQFDLSELTSATGVFDYFGAKEIITPKSMGNTTLRLWHYFRDDDENHYNYITSDTPTKHKIYANDAILNWGSSVNVSIKKLINSSITSAGSDDNTIRKIVRSEELPDDSIEKKNIAYYLSQYPIYFWVIDGVGYYYSQGERIYLNSDCKSMFQSFNVLTEIDYSTIDFYFAEDMSYMFSSTASNATGDVTFNFDNIKLPNLTNAYDMFPNFCKNCNSISLSFKNASNPKLTNLGYMFQGFGYNAKTVTLDMTNWYIPSANSLYYSFDTFGYYSDYVTIEGENVDISNATSIAKIFSNTGSNAKKIKMNLKNWKTGNLTTMEWAFNFVSGGSELFDIDLTGWDTSKVTSLNKTFNYAGSRASTFKIKGINKWDVSSVTDFYETFYSAGNNSTTFELDLSEWNTSSATDMSCMFGFMGTSARNVTFGKLDNWDTSKLTNIYSMFYYTFDNYSGVVDIGSFDIYGPKAEYVFTQFDGLKGTINIHNKLTNYSSIFSSVATNTGASVTVNYTSEVDNIDDIIATKSSTSNVIKGELID